MDGYATFNTAPYAAYTTKELLAAVEAGRGTDKMTGEIERRAKRDAGDYSVMTPGERLSRNRKLAAA